MTADVDQLAVQTFADAQWRVLEWSRELMKGRPTTPMFEVLVALGRCKDFTLSYDDLGDVIGRSRRTMQYVVSDMCATGLVEVVPSWSDRRRRVIRLSQRGRTIVAGYKDKILEEMGDLMPLMSSSGKPASQQIYGLRGLAIVSPNETKEEAPPLRKPVPA